MIVIQGKIRGKQRPKVFNGHGVTPKQTVEYENWIKLCYKQQKGEYLEGPIRLILTAYYKIPKSYTKKRIQSIKQGLEYPQKKPDIDNCIKVILDALNGIAFEDDKQVVEVTALKRYTEEEERVEIELEEIINDEKN